MSDAPKLPTEQLMDAGRVFYERGWARGASGNYSLLLARNPMRLCITAAGNDKGALDETNFLELDNDAEILQGFGRPSKETLLHLTIYRLRPRARCILYSQTAAGIALAERNFVDGASTFQGFEALKGLSGVSTHEHREDLPILENSDDAIALSHVVENILLESSEIHGFYIRRHGLLAWGENVEEARRHIETFEFLFDVVSRIQA